NSLPLRKRLQAHSRVSCAIAWCCCRTATNPGVCPGLGLALPNRKKHKCSLQTCPASCRNNLPLRLEPVQFILVS
uniref:Uncharacterized protein n=1 Tax=Cairina moschata TaxID=8855 RepID=A0A8C3D602_CAIMO